MILEIIFVVCCLLALVGSIAPPEPYGRYWGLFLVIAVICLGIRVFGGIH